MKAIVLKKFKDKHTGKMHEVGEIFNCTKKRFAEIQSVDPELVAEHEEPIEEPNVSAE